MRARHPADPVADGRRAPRTLTSFRNIHAGGSIVVCGCGESLNTLTTPEHFVTIGVNDVGRKFDPDYLVVVDPPEAFKGDRFHYVKSSRARVFFTQRSDLGIDHPNMVRFRLGAKDGTDFSDPEVLNYSVTTPYVALCLAVHMGAASIGLIGIDFTDHHFFGPTGRHNWTPYIETIDAQFDHLCRAAVARGSRVFNLSERSRLTAAPKMTLDTFASLRGGRTGEHLPLRIVSYATTPLVGVPTILARCINARTPHYARCVWAHDRYRTGISFVPDINWHESPSRAEEEIGAADVIVLHNGKVDQRHRALIESKPIVTMAHNYMANVDDSFVRRGFPGVVVGQYQATLPEFRGWSVVPSPVPLWEQDHRSAAKNAEVTIGYTPSDTHQVHPREHRLYWHGKGYDATMRVLDRLAARYPIRLVVTRDGFLPHAELLRLKQRAHIVIDECVTGSYHRNSLEGLAAGCVVVNGVGLLPGVLEALRFCAEDPEAAPFVRADLSTLERRLADLIEFGPDLLAMVGASNREWMEQHWEFGRQWDRFWQMVIDDAIRVADTPPSLGVKGISASEVSGVRPTRQNG